MHGFYGLSAFFLALVFYKFNKKNHSHSSLYLFRFFSRPYLSGYEYVGLLAIAKYWKNGFEIILDGANVKANSIFVENNDVYVCGNSTSSDQKPHAVFWKNGTINFLTDGSEDSNATAIFVKGTDVYIAGYERNGLNTEAKFWKNGVPTSLTHSSTNSIGYAFSIFVQ